METGDAAIAASSNRLMLARRWRGPSVRTPGAGLGGEGLTQGPTWRNETVSLRFGESALERVARKLQGDNARHRIDRAVQCRAWRSGRNRRSWPSLPQGRSSSSGCLRWSCVSRRDGNRRGCLDQTTTGIGRAGRGPPLWPWLNARIGVSYTHYLKLFGAATISMASDNNTVFLYSWIMFCRGLRLA
jgi:hypothetical protein